MERERAQLKGKIQIVKAFAIPKFMSKAALIHVSMAKDLSRAANKELYNFIWNGKDKVKRTALISDIDCDGLKMLDIESMVLAQRIICLKKYAKEYVRSWTIFLEKVGGKLILHWQFDLHLLCH